jgi:outer membrane protein assembly factor BamA
LDYYRVKKGEIRFSPSLIRRFRGGHTLRFTSHIEQIEVQDTPNRYIATVNDSSLNIFEENYFAGGEANFNHYRVDNTSFPTKGMHFDLTVGAKTKIGDWERRFGYIKTSLAIYQNLVQNRSVVFASEIGSHINIGNRFEIYQAATLGGDKSLRGFNRQRFTGKESMYHSNDIRIRFGKLKTSFLPLKIGVSTGFDYGRVWSPRESKNSKWHTSYGGSLWINAIDFFTLNISYFQGNTEEERLALSIGFAF